MLPYNFIQYIPTLLCSNLPWRYRFGVLEFKRHARHRHHKRWSPNEKAVALHSTTFSLVTGYSTFLEGLQQDDNMDQVIFRPVYMVQPGMNLSVEARTVSSVRDTISSRWNSLLIEKCTLLKMLLN